MDKASTKIKKLEHPISYFLLYLITWPRRQYRLSRGLCPWCNRQLKGATCHGGIFRDKPGKIAYCLDYHYFKSDCETTSDGSKRVRVKLQHSGGLIPHDVMKALIDNLRSMFHRDTMYGKIKEAKQATTNLGDKNNE